MVSSSSIYLSPFLSLSPSLLFPSELIIRVIGLHDHDECGGPNSDLPTRGSIIQLTLNQLIESDYTDDYDDEQQPLWIQVENASPKELARIGEHFGLHPLTVEGIQTRHTREKLEIFQNYLFLVFHALHGGSVPPAQYETKSASTRPAPGTFAANTIIDPFDTSGRAHPHPTPSGGRLMDESEDGAKSPSELSEVSRLLSGQDTIKYYGGNASHLTIAHERTTIPNNVSNVNAFVQPSPHPPRRHKSSVSLAQSASTHNLAQPQSHQPGHKRTPSPQGSPVKKNMIGRERPMPLTTHSERFQMHYPLGMGPDDLSPEFSSSGSSGTSGASDTSCSDFDDESSNDQTPVAPRSPRSPRSALLGITSPQPAAATPAQPKKPIAPTITSSFTRTSEPLRTSPIKLVVFPHLVLSFHSSNLDTVGAVRHRLARVYSDTVESTAWIIHALLDSITDSLLPVVNATAVEVDALEELIYVLSGSEHRDLLKRMGMTRRRLSFLRQRLWSKRDILMSLIGKDWALFLAGVQIPYLRDVYDHVVTMLHKVEAASDLLLALQNTYLANVQIDVAEASNDANIVMKNLTAVGAIILPMQLVARSVEGKTDARRRLRTLHSRLHVNQLLILYALCFVWSSFSQLVGYEL